MLFFVSTLFLIGLTLLPSISRNIHGSSRWLTFFKFSFQPSEIVKIALIFYLARFLEKKSLKKNNIHITTFYFLHTYWHNVFFAS